MSPAQGGAAEAPGPCQRCGWSHPSQVGVMSPFHTPSGSLPLPASYRPGRGPKSCPQQCPQSRTHRRRSLRACRVTEERDLGMAPSGPHSVQSQHWTAICPLSLWRAGHREGHLLANNAQLFPFLRGQWSTPAWTQACSVQRWARWVEVAPRCSTEPF